MKRFSTVSPLRAVRGLLATGAVAASLVVASAATASAQINFIASTQFRFNGIGSFANTATYGGLKFTGGSFSITTNGPGDIQGIGGTGNSFGTALATSLFNYNSPPTTLAMLVTFSSPTTGLQTFSALISGNIQNNRNGAIVSWSPTSINNIPFTVAPYTSGTFNLAVNGISASINGGNQDISGSITEVSEVTTTPEPASFALLGTGLLGMFGVSIRRRRK